MYFVPIHFVGILRLSLLSEMEMYEQYNISMENLTQHKEHIYSLISLKNAVLAFCIIIFVNI